MFGIRDKKDIDTIKQLEELIDYLKKELDDTKNELAQLKITADLRLKEIYKLRAKIPEEEKPKRRKTIAKKEK
jgi:regulator of replication initiation timing